MVQLVSPVQHHLAWMEQYRYYKRLVFARHFLGPAGRLGGGKGVVIVNRLLRYRRGVELEPYDLDGGDSNLWTGVLLATLALEYRLTGDLNLIDTVQQILDAWEWLESGRPAVPPKAPGYLPRATEIDSPIRQQEPSGDQYTGILVGLTFACRFVDNLTVQGRIRDLANRIGERMSRDWYFIFRPQGGLSNRGAECVQWEYTWGYMLARITGDTRVSREFSIEAFWNRLSSDEHACIVKNTLLLLPVSELLAELSGISGVWTVIGAGLGGFVGALIGSPAGAAVMAFVGALFMCLKESPLGVLLHLLHPNDPLGKHRQWIGTLRGMDTDLKRLSDQINHLTHEAGLGRVVVPQIDYFNFHVTFLASLGAFFETGYPDDGLKGLYEHTLKSSGDRNPFFALVIRALYGGGDVYGGDSVTNYAINILDEPGRWPTDHLPNSREDHVVSHGGNYAWQHDPSTRDAIQSDFDEWPGLDFMFPVMLRAYLQRAMVSPDWPPALIQLL